MRGHKIKSKTAYLIAPKMGGFANNTIIQTEDKEVLYNVKSKILSVSGRQYRVTDSKRNEVLTTRQDHTILFPRHQLISDGREVGAMGQAGIIPHKYSIEIRDIPRAEVHVGPLQPIFKLKTKSTILAEIAQHRGTWITVLHTDRHAELLLLAIAILSRENTIGG